MLGIKGRHSHGADSHLGETELDILTNRRKELDRFCWRGEGREGLQETEQFQKQPWPSPAKVLPGCHIFWETLFTCPLQKERNLLSAIILAPDMNTYHLDRAYSFQKIWNYSPHDPNGQQEGSEFSMPRWALRNTADLPWRVVDSLFWSKKEEHMIRLRFS